MECGGGEGRDGNGEGRDRNGAERIANGKETEVGKENGRRVTFCAHFRHVQ